MLTKILCAVVATAICMSTANANDVKPHPAPFNLYFGMKPAEVQLQKANPPKKPSIKIDLSPMCRKYGDCKLTKIIGDYDEYNIAIKRWDKMLKGCKATFEKPMTLYGKNRDWAQWVSKKLDQNKILDLSPADVMYKPKVKLLTIMMRGYKFPDPSIAYSIGIYSLETRNTDKHICLVFTNNGLTSIYMPNYSIRN